MYIRRVTLRQFQCHQDLEVELGPGLNAILGESDRGKTAVLRAIRWVLFNRPDGLAFRRNGASDPTIVTLELDDGTIIRRTRSSRVNRYELERPGAEPMTFDNFGREVPEEIVGATGVKPAVFRREGMAIELSYGGQFTPPFLLSESGLVRAQVIGYISRTSILDTVSRRLNEDIRALGRDIVTMERDRDRLRDELARFDDLEERDRWLRGIEEGAEALGRRFETLRDAEITLRELAETERSLEGFRTRAVALERLPDPDRIALLGDRYADGARIVRELASVDEDLGRMRSQIAQLEGGDVDLEALAACAATVEKAEVLQADAMAWKRVYLAETAELERVEAEEAAARSEYVATLRRVGVCPVCFQTVDDDAAAHLEEALAEIGTE